MARSPQAAATIRHQLDVLGYHASTHLTVLTDGAAGLRDLVRMAAATGAALIFVLGLMRQSV